MKKDTEKFEVVLKSDNPLFVPVYHTFLESSVLDGKEKIIFIILKKFLTVGTEQGAVYPKLETICKYAGMTKKTVIKIIKSLQDKGILMVEQRGLNKPNLYTLKDYSQMWKVESKEELKAAVDDIEEKRMIDLLTAKGYYISKEKGLVSTEPTKVTAEPSTRENNFPTDNNTTTGAKSQAGSERYSLEDVRALYEYESLIIQYPEKLTDLDIVFDILYDTLNSTKPTIRVGGEDRPQMAVICKLVKLQPNDLVYSIEKYHEQDQRIKNVKSYMLTLLYNSREQNHLDIMNLGHTNHDF